MFFITFLFYLILIKYMHKLKQLSLDRFGLRFKHTEKLLKEHSELKRKIPNPTPVSKEMQRAGTLYANDLKRFFEKEGIRVLNVNLFGSTKRGSAVRGSDVDLNIVIKFPKTENIKEELNNNVKKFIGRNKKHSETVPYNMHVNVFSENELKKELLSNPDAIHIFLTSKPLIGRKNYYSIRKEIIDFINRNPKIIKELEKKQNITKEKIKKRDSLLKTARDYDSKRKRLIDV